MGPVPEPFVLHENVRCVEAMHAVGSPGILIRYIVPVVGT
jgi:hypothetical protein